MNYKIRFFDILNCILLGSSSIALVLFSKSLITETDFIKFILGFLELGQGDATKINIYAVLFAISIVYSAGLIVNSLVDWLSNSVSVKAWSSNYIFQMLFFHGINNSCYIIKKNAKKEKFFSSDYSSWIFFSNNPYRILSVLIERISQFKDENILNEYRYLNEFFQGLFYVLMGCMFYLLSHVTINDVDFQSISLKILLTEDNETEKKSTVILSYIWCYLFFIISSILCAILSKFYARKLIKYISACIDAHKIDINDIVFENGLPTAYILMKININCNYEQLRNSLESIAMQNYKNIKVIMFIFGVKNSSGMTEYTFNKLITSYFNNEFMQLIKFRREEFDKAEAALEIRKIFCDTARKEDIAIFLDPSDELDNKQTVSEIVKKFAITDANMCLLNFTETANTEHSLIRHDKVVYDNILEYIEHKKGSYCFSDDFQLHAAMTLNCVKAYKKEVLSPFVDAIKNFDKNMPKVEGKTYFSKTGSYASFIDFLTFLVKGVKLTAISKSTHKYVQHKNKHDVKTFTNFLNERVNAIEYLLDLSCCSKDKFIDDSFVKVFMYFKFKLYVISLLVESLQFKSDDQNEPSKNGDSSKEKNMDIFIERFNVMLYQFMESTDTKACELSDYLRGKNVLNNESIYFNLINPSLLQKCFDDAKNNSDNNLKSVGLFSDLLKHFKSYSKLKKIF